jgi:hypothetical protein
MHIVAIWNTKGRNCLDACNKNWLIELGKEIPRQSGKSFTSIITTPTPLQGLQPGIIAQPIGPNKNQSKRSTAALENL